MGCYLDPFALISANLFTFTSAGNTNALCRATCYTKGFAYSATTTGLQVRSPCRRRPGRELTICLVHVLELATSRGRGAHTVMQRAVPW
jgi:hypothetical protein